MSSQAILYRGIKPTVKTTTVNEGEMIVEQKNLSVFGDIVRNEEIADFVRLVNLTRDIFHQELTVLEIMPGGLTNKNFRAVLEDGT
jgi:hypothetical protein